MKTINFSLYGTGYDDGLLPNIAAAKVHFPGWQVQVFHDGCLDGRQDLEGVNLFRMFSFVGSGMFWRFLGAAGSECAIFRDIDSLLNARDAAAVAAWVESGTAVHVMQDHRHHTNMPAGCILGGMWGLRPAGLSFDFPQLVQWWLDHKVPSGYGADMWFLNRYIWPHALRSGMMHLRHYSMVVGSPWPRHPPVGGYVGQRVFGPKAGQD